MEILPGYISISFDLLVIILTFQDLVFTMCIESFVFHFFVLLGYQSVTRLLNIRKCKLILVLLV